MPLFTFDCEGCGEAFEELVSFGRDLDDIRCPKCGGEETRKRMSLVARTIRAGSTSSYQVAAPSCSPGGT